MSDDWKLEIFLLSLKFNAMAKIAGVLSTPLIFCQRRVQFSHRPCVQNGINCNPSLGRFQMLVAFWRRISTNISRPALDAKFTKNYLLIRDFTEVCLSHDNKMSLPWIVLWTFKMDINRSSELQLPFLWRYVGVWLLHLQKQQLIPQNGEFSPSKTHFAPLSLQDLEELMFWKTSPAVYLVMLNEPLPLSARRTNASTNNLNKRLTNFCDILIG